MLGPRRVLSGDVDSPQPPPYGLTDNEHSLLDVADMVFIDPVSTGYSRPAPGEEAKQFHGLEEDLASVGEFIRLFVTRYGRWLSPKFLVGESYGTTRAAGLAGHLQERHGLYLNGLVLVSMVLDFQTLIFAPNNDLPYIVFLPTYAATARYHGRLADDVPDDLGELLAEVEAFAQGEYAAALFQGTKLTDEERAEIAAKLARYTGLSPAYIEAVNLRIEIFRFTHELLREDRRTVGRLDSRFRGIERDAAGERISYDPSYPAIQGPYTAAFNDYVRRELGFEVDLPYEVLTSLYEQWSYRKYENRYAEVAETLRKAMTHNPFLKVYVANGFYDLATPYFATEYTLNHLMLDPTLQPNIRTGHFEAGHMMYVHAPSLARLNEEVRAFVREAS
jgi:carboxypeptidase C (cathepsin A)